MESFQCFVKNIRGDFMEKNKSGNKEPIISYCDIDAFWEIIIDGKIVKRYTTRPRCIKYLRSRGYIVK